MPNGNAFWAAGKHIVTSTNPTTPTSVETPNESNNKSPTHQKNGLVSKTRNNTSVGDALSNGNGVDLATPGVKKVSWADDEEDEKFLTLLASQQEDLAVSSLETTIALKDEQIKELEATIVTKDLRIAELEVTIRDSHEQMGDLQKGMSVKENTMKTLEKENHAQFVKIQELYRESTEKDHHIQSLESSLKRLTVAPHHEQMSISETQSSTTNADAKGAETVRVEATNSVPTMTTEKSENGESPHSGESISKVVEASAAEDTKNDQTEKPTPVSPSHGTEFPTFVTKETLKVVPPAPKPRILTFPIDLSKYGKKSPTALPTKQLGQSPASIAGKSNHTMSRGQQSRQTRIKTDAKPAFNPSVDIRHMSSAVRVLYGNGPDVVFKLGDIELKTIPQYILMQCSGKAFQYFKANPTATSWTFPAGSMDADAAKSILNWMGEMTFQARVYSITLNTAAINDQKNAQICRAARFMGLNNSYIGHFTKHFCDRIRDKNVTYELLDLLCKFAYPENDPVFDCLANKLAMQKAAGSVQGKAVLEKLSATYPPLRAKVEKIERRMGAVRARK